MQDYFRNARGWVASSSPAILIGIVIGLGSSAMIFRAGEANAGTDFNSDHAYIEAQPVINRTEIPRVDLSAQSSIIAAVRKVGPAVVNIDVTEKPGADDGLSPYFHGVLPPEARKGEGSGIIINGRKGYVLTNNHVVQDTSLIRVQLKDGRSYTGKVLGVDRFSDVALVKIPGGDLPTATLGRSTDLPEGSWAIAIGNPLGFQHTITVGVISARDRILPAPSGMPLEDLIQTDAAINRGNSGGALCDINGNVIGMNTAIIPSAQGLGFAVAVETVKYVVDELLKHGKVTRSWLGVQFLTLDDETAKQNGVKMIPGVIVLGVEPGNPAAEAGLKKLDVVTAVDQRPITDADELRDLVRRHKPGDRLNFLIARQGHAMLFPVKLGTMPDSLVGDRSP